MISNQLDKGVQTFLGHLLHFRVVWRGLGASKPRRKTDCNQTFFTELACLRSKIRHCVL